MKTGAPHAAKDDAPDFPETGPERRCIVTGTVGPKAGLLRFAVSPDGVLVPDISERLPGRGLWVTADRDNLTAAIQKNLFARAARKAVTVPPDCLDLVVKLLRQRLIDLIGFARRAGAAVSGFEKVETLARRKRVEALLIASDSGKDGRQKLEALVQGTHIIDVLDANTLGGIFGAIGIVVYAGISDKAQAVQLTALAAKLKAVMPQGMANGLKVTG